jgi:hypothetical protein
MLLTADVCTLAQWMNSNGLLWSLLRSRTSGSIKGGKFLDCMSVLLTSHEGFCSTDLFLILVNAGVFGELKVSVQASCFAGQIWVGSCVLMATHRLIKLCVRCKDECWIDMHLGGSCRGLFSNAIRKNIEGIIKTSKKPLSAISNQAPPKYNSRFYQ